MYHVTLHHLVNICLCFCSFVFYKIFFYYHSDAFKKRFVASIAESNAQVFTEDLRNMIMSATNDQEIDTVIQGLRKFVKSKKCLFDYLKKINFFRYNANKVKFSDYHFGSPIMRLLYVQNKIDLALELYMDEVKHI